MYYRHSMSRRPVLFVVVIGKQNKRLNVSIHYSNRPRELLSPVKHAKVCLLFLTLYTRATKVPPYNTGDSRSRGGVVENRKYRRSGVRPQ